MVGVAAVVAAGGRLVAAVAAVGRPAVAAGRPVAAAGRPAAAVGRPAAATVAAVADSSAVVGEAPLVSANRKKAEVVSHIPCQCPPLPSALPGHSPYKRTLAVPQGATSCWAW